MNLQYSSIFFSLFLFYIYKYIDFQTSNLTDLWCGSCNYQRFPSQRSQQCAGGASNGSESSDGQWEGNNSNAGTSETE